MSYSLSLPALGVVLLFAVLCIAALGYNRRVIKNLRARRSAPAAVISPVGYTITVSHSGYSDVPMFSWMRDPVSLYQQEPWPMISKNMKLEVMSYFYEHFDKKNHPSVITNMIISIMCIQSGASICMAITNINTPLVEIQDLTNPAYGNVYMAVMEGTRRALSVDVCAHATNLVMGHIDNFRINA